MPEFMEQGARVLEGEQCRLSIRRLGEVHHIDDDRFLIAVDAVLGAKGAHPGSGPFRWPGEIIAQKQPDMLAIGAHYLKDADIRVIDRQTGEFLERNAEQAMGRVEGGVDDLVELQIRLQFRLVEVVFFDPDFFRVVAPVPWLDGDVVTAPAGVVRKIGFFSVRFFNAGRPHARQEIPNGFGRLRHAVVQFEMREGIKAKQAGFFGAQRQRL